MLVGLVGIHRVTRTIVDRRDAEHGESRHIGPAELGADLAADRLDEGLGRGAVETGQRAAAEIVAAYKGK